MLFRVCVLDVNFEKRMKIENIVGKLESYLGYTADDLLNTKWKFHYTCTKDDKPQEAVNFINLTKQECRIDYDL